MLMLLGGDSVTQACSLVLMRSPGPGPFGPLGELWAALRRWLEILESGQEA